jgi:hypothetical protein
MPKEYPIYICNVTFNEYARNDNDVFDVDPRKRNVAFTFKLLQTAQTLQQADKFVENIFTDLKDAEKAVWAKSQLIPPLNKRTTLVAAPFSGNSILITLEQDHFNHLKDNFNTQTDACKPLADNNLKIKCNFDITKVPNAQENAQDFDYRDSFGGPDLQIDYVNTDRSSLLDLPQIPSTSTMVPPNMGGKRHQRKTKRRKHNKRKSHFKRK